MKTIKTISIDTFKAQNHIQHLFLIKTSKVYRDENGQDTTTKRCYGTPTEDGEPMIWLTRTAAIAAANKDFAGLEVSTIEYEKDGETKTTQVISKKKADTLGVL